MKLFNNVYFSEGKGIMIRSHDDYSHIALFDQYSGQVDKYLTSGTFDVTDICGFNYQSGHVYVILT